MHSKDIAALAEVTHRTLRHYHQIGLLPEPPRDRNGYRRYEVPHLVRLLRIKGLAAAGVALSAMPAFLDRRGASADDLLDALDRQLLDQIEHLHQQRQLVARLRGGADAEIGLDASFRMLADGRSDSSNETWRDQLTLFSHLLSAEDLAKLNAIYGRMAGQSEDFLALGKRFDALGPDSGEEEIADLAAAYLSHFRDIFSDFADMLAVPDKKGISRLISAHAISSANDSQRKMFGLLADLMK